MRGIRNGERVKPCDCGDDGSCRAAGNAAGRLRLEACNRGACGGRHARRADSAFGGADRLWRDSGAVDRKAVHGGGAAGAHTGSVLPCCGLADLPAQPDARSARTSRELAGAFRGAGRHHRHRRIGAVRAGWDHDWLVHTDRGGCCRVRRGIGDCCVPAKAEHGNDARGFAGDAEDVGHALSCHHRSADLLGVRQRDGFCGAWWRDGSRARRPACSVRS